MEGFEGLRSIQPWTVIAPEDGPRAAQQLYKRLAAKNWRVEILHAVTMHAPVYYLSKSEHHNVGDLKKGRFVADHWALRARLDAPGRSVARALVTWDRERPAEGAKAKPVSFDAGHSWDLVNNFIEFHRTAGAFEEWVSILAPKPPSKSKPRAQPKPTSLEVEIAEGVWHG